MRISLQVSCTIVIGLHYSMFIALQVSGLMQSSLPYACHFAGERCTVSYRKRVSTCRATPSSTETQTNHKVRQTPLIFRATFGRSSSCSSFLQRHDLTPQKPAKQTQEAKNRLFLERFYLSRCHTIKEKKWRKRIVETKEFSQDPPQFHFLLSGRAAVGFIFGTLCKYSSIMWSTRTERLRTTDVLIGLSGSH